jgi:uncharacterized membrane protein
MRNAMVAISVTRPSRPLHPLHSIFLAFPFSLFLSALVSDLAYWQTFEIQWANFSSWLIAGGLFVGAFAVLWALVNLFRRDTGSKGRAALYFLVLLVTWVLGFVNALVHAKDAWAIMPEGLYLSALVTLLAFVAAWIGYSGFRGGEVE